MPSAPLRSVACPHPGYLRRGRLARVVAIAALLAANMSVGAIVLAAADQSSAGAAPRPVLTPGGRPASEGKSIGERAAEVQHSVQIKRAPPA